MRRKEDEGPRTVIQESYAMTSNGPVWTRTTKLGVQLRRNIEVPNFDNPIQVLYEIKHEPRKISTS